MSLEEFQAEILRRVDVIELSLSSLTSQLVRMHKLVERAFATVVNRGQSAANFREQTEHAET